VGASPEARRTRLLSLARAAAELPEPQRRHAVAGLIRERFGAEEFKAAFRGDPPVIPCTVEEIILCAYPTTGHYWRAWLYGRLDRYELIRRLAEATAVSEIDLQRRRRRLDVALAACPLNIDDSAAEVATRWLADHPDAEGLLPPSLVSYLRPGERSADPANNDASATLTEPAGTETKPPANSESAMATPAPAPSAGGRRRPGPRPGETDVLRQQRAQLARRLRRMQRGRYKEERNYQTLDRFLKANQDFKLPGGGSEDYRREQILRELSKMKCK
jgi:hypothetical protein